MILSRNGSQVVLWAHRPEYLHEIRQKHANEQYLPGIALPAEWQFEEKIENAIAKADAVIVAIPSKAFRKIAEHLSWQAGAVALDTAVNVVQRLARGADEDVRERGRHSLIS